MDDRPPHTQYVLEEQVGFLLRKANQRHRTLFSRMMIKGVPPSQLAALAKLGFDEPLHQNQLGRLVAMDSATITGVVKRLTEKGLVESHHDPHDSRLSILNLTDAGQKLLSSVLARAFEISDATLEPLSAEERRIFLELLGRIADGE